MVDNVADRVREQVSGFAGGTGVVTLPVVAVAGDQTFLSGWGASGTGDYCLQMGSQWEVGFGTLNAGGTTLTRTTVYGSYSGGTYTAGAACNFNAGTLDCFGTLPAELMQHLNMREITVASAATCDIGSASGSNIIVSGTTTITSFGTKKNRRRFVRFSGALTVTNGANLVLPGGANITTIAGDTAIFQSDGSGTPIWRCLDYKSATYAPFSGKLIKSTVFTASGTWTRSAGCHSVVAEVIGGAGAGGGAVAGTASQAAVGSGGGGGGYSMRRITAPGATETVTVGAGGAVGTAGNNPGNAGGTSSFGSWCSASGGGGGAGCASGVDSTHVGGIGGVGGTGSGGDLNLTGQNGGNGIFGTATNASFYYAGPGGMGARGGGGGAPPNGQGNGGAGNNYGGGGGGGVSDHLFNTGAAVTGGAGAGGAVIVWEFE